MKKLTALLLALALLLCGCGDQAASLNGAESVQREQKTTASPTVAELDVKTPPYYTVTYKEAGSALADARQMLWQSGRLLCSKSGGRNDYNERCLFWAEPYGDGQKTILTTSGDDVINCFCMGQDGNIYAVVSQWMEDALVGPEEGMLMDGYENSRLLVLDQEGNSLGEYPLPQEGQTSYGSVAADADGRIFLERNEFDPEKGFYSDHFLDRLEDGNVTATMAAEDMLEGANIVGFLTAQDGTLLLNIQVDDWPRVYGLDPDTLQLSDEPYFTYSSEMQWPSLHSGGAGMDFYALDDNTGLTGYTLSGETFSYFKVSQLPSTVPESASFVAATGENRFLMRYTLLETLYFIEIEGSWEAPPDSEKISLTLGASREYISSVDLSEMVVAFNILNPDYEMVLKDYSGGDGMTASDTMREALNQDILDGEGPDLLVMDEYTFLCNTYAGNGFLRDLYPLMDADPEFDRSDYLENIWAACESQGKLYGLITQFEVETLVTNRNYFDAPAGWTPSECLKLSQESEIPLMEGVDYEVDWRDRFLSRYLLGDGLQYYINGDTCDFASGEFAALLELLNQDYPVLEEEETFEDCFPVKNGVVLTGMKWLAMADEILRLRFECGGNYVLTGFPSPARSQISISPMVNIGISSTTEYPEVCWDFLKMILNAVDENLSTGWGMGFSTNRSVLEDSIYRTTLPADDPDACNMEISYGFGENETVDVTLEPVSQAQAEELIGLIESTKCAMVDAETREIVEEEVDAFFAGDKTAEQTADVIQNRVQIHLWEQYG